MEDQGQLEHLEGLMVDSSFSLLIVSIWIIQDHKLLICGLNQMNSKKIGEFFFFLTCTKHAQTFLPSYPSLNTKYQTIHGTFALTLHCVRFLPSRDDCKNRRGFVCCADSTLFPIRDLNIHLATMGVLEPMSPVSQRETILTLQFWVCVCVGGGIHTSSVISR